MLDAGAFSNRDVVEASRDLTLILVDLSSPPKNWDRARKHKVTIPSRVFFFDPDGNKVGELKSRSPAAVVAQFKKLASDFSGKLSWPDSITKAMTLGREKAKPVLLFHAGSSDDSRVTEASLSERGLKEVLQKFVTVRHEVEKNCDQCTLLKVRRGPIILLLNPNLSFKDAAKKPLAKYAGRKSSRVLKKSLTQFLKRRWPKILENAKGK